MMMMKMMIITMLKNGNYYCTKKNRNHHIQSFSFFFINFFFFDFLITSKQSRSHFGPWLKKIVFFYMEFTVKISSKSIASNSVIFSCISLFL